MAEAASGARRIFLHEGRRHAATASPKDTIISVVCDTVSKYIFQIPSPIFRRCIATKQWGEVSWNSIFPNSACMMRVKKWCSKPMGHLMLLMCSRDKGNSLGAAIREPEMLKRSISDIWRRVCQGSSSEGRILSCVRGGLSTLLGTNGVRAASFGSDNLWTTTYPVKLLVVLLTVTTAYSR